MTDEKAPPQPPGQRRRRRRKPGAQSGERAEAAKAEPAKVDATRPEQRAARGEPGERRRDQGPRQGKGRRDGKGRDGRGRDGGRPDKPRPVIRATEATVDRGAGFVISKRTEFDATTHKPLAVRYKLTREGLPEPRTYARLADAREDAKKPIEELLPPPPPPEPPAAEAEAAPPGAPEAAPGETATTEAVPAEGE